MKVLKGLTIFLISLSLFAAAVPKEKINNVNKYIKVLIDDFADDFSVKITSASTDDSTKKLNKMKASFDFARWGKLKLGLALVNKEVVLTGKYSLIDTDGEYNSPEAIRDMMDDLNRELDKFNAKGFYNATAVISRDNKIAKLKLTVLPVSKKAVAIKKLVLKAKVPYGANAKITFSLKGQFNTTANLVSLAQDGLTGIFNDLADQKEPKESDFEKLGEVFENIMRDLD